MRKIKFYNFIEAYYPIRVNFLFVLIHVISGQEKKDPLITQMNTNIFYKEEAYRIIGASMEVHIELEKLMNTSDFRNLRLDRSLENSEAVYSPPKKTNITLVLISAISGQEKMIH